MQARRFTREQVAGFGFEIDNLFQSLIDSDPIHLLQRLTPMTTIWPKIKTLLAHRLLVELALIGSFLAFSLHPGAIGDFMRICGALFLANLFLRQYRLKNLTIGHIIMLGIVLAVVLLNLLMPADKVHDRSLSYFMAFPGIVLATHLLAKRAKTENCKEFRTLCLFAILFAVFTQFCVYMIQPKGASFGVYSNLHHLGLFSSVTLPALAFFYFEFAGWLRLPVLIALLVDFYLLWDSSSRISWLGFFGGITFTLLAFFRKKQLAYFGAVLIVLSLAAAYISGFAHIQSRVQDFMTNWRTEERVFFWTDTLELLKKNSAKDWMLGHGIGSFRYYFSEYSGLTAEKLNLSINYPHNVFLQIIFENGVLGFVIIFGGLFYIPWALWRQVASLTNQHDRALLITTFAAFWIALIHCVLNKSLYSKYVLYSFSIILGTSLVLLERSGKNRPWQARPARHQPHANDGNPLGTRVGNQPH